MIRGLALRSLTGLRLTSILEYVLQPLKASLSDASGYVRQAGVIGVLKVYSISPESIKENDFVDTLYNMLRDRDPQVVVNCITALNEILGAEGGIAVNQAIVVYLLNRIREFTDWGQCVVMDLVARYKPASEDEMFGIMNLLDGCLKVANSAVVMGATKCFLAFTQVGWVRRGCGGGWQRSLQAGHQHSPLPPIQAHTPHTRPLPTPSGAA